MIQYEVNLNNGVEAFGTGKTITANEVLLTCDEKALAREIHHQNSLIPEEVAASVLGYFGKAAAQLMAMGFAIQFKLDKELGEKNNVLSYASAIREGKRVQLKFVDDKTKED